MRQILLPSILAIAFALPAPSSAQTLEQRFERWFGPPAREAGQGPQRRPAQRQAQSERPRAPASLRVPAAASVPTPSERPAGDETAAEEGEEAPAPVAPEAEVLPPPADEDSEPDAGEAPPPDPEAVPTPDSRPADEAVPADADAAPQADEPDEPADAQAATEAETDAAVDAQADEDLSEPARAYVPPAEARTEPEPSAPKTPASEITPAMSVEAAQAIEDARECEAELEARGAVFTVEPSLAEGECGVLRPIALAETSTGITVSPQTRMLCRTALAFDVWVGTSVVAAARDELDGDVPTAIGQASTYVCRDRASESGLSEHGRGSAIDVGRIEFDDREPILVEDQAPGSPEDRFLAAIRRAACGPFQTVIGPGTDADHSDHFHLDIAARSNGSTYCR